MTTAVDPRLPPFEAKPGSDRSFGVVFAIVFAVIGGWPLVRGEPPRWWAIGIGAAFVLAAALAPRLLRPLNRVWLKFGLLLNRVVSPLVMGAVFFLCVTPIALIMKLLGKDVLSLRRRSDLATYWIGREPPGPEPQTMKNQF